MAAAGVVAGCELVSWAHRKLGLERVALLGEEHESLDRFGQKRGLVRLGTGVAVMAGVVVEDMVVGKEGEAMVVAP